MDSFSFSGYPHLTIYAGQDKQGNASVFRLITPRDIG